MRIRNFLLAAVAWGLGGAYSAPPQNQDAQVIWHVPTDPQVTSAVAKAQVAIKSLVGTLLPAVTAAVEAGGPVQGVTLCQVQAQPLTRQTLGNADPAITGLKRTSQRVRNPANAPDAAEKAALDRVSALILDGREPPPLLVQSLAATADQPAEIRVYRSMTVAPGCLACHGDASAFAPDLQATLQAHYPNDQAVGYREGDWRGLIRVSVSTALP